MNQNLNKYMQEHLAAIQQKELSILCVIHDICERNNIDYWLDGGTCLGAVRHKGFIPWDDDIDIAIRKEDIPRFIEAAKRELPENLFLQTKETDPTDPHPMLKIRDMNSLLVEYGDDFKQPYEKGLYVDIFPMIPYPNMSRKLCRHIAKGYCRAYNIMHKRQRVSLHAVAEYFWFGMKRAYFSILWRILNATRKKDYLSNVLNQCGYGIMHRKENVFPTKPITFEGKTFRGPANPDAYNTEIYGNYMQLPPEDKRKGHAAFYIEKLT
jgi:lipopolysaccharide cholinephosphotransferase